MGSPSQEARATLRVRPFTPLASSTATYSLAGGPEQSVQLTRDGDEWTVEFDAEPGQTIEYSFFLPISDGANTLHLRSATHNAVVGNGSEERPGPLLVDTAGRFRDRHENELRFEPFIAGYFEASTFAVLLLDFGDALDVTVAVADEAEFVDIKLFDQNPSRPHERSREVRADYRVAARMLAYDDPQTGVRTWHWRQERNEVLDRDLAPGELVDLEFTIRRVQSQPVHSGSNGQYYTAIFRHRMGERGLTEVVDLAFSRPGDATSVYVISEPQWAFAQAARNLDHDGLVTFLRGKQLFDRDLEAEAAPELGPRYDAASCAECHVRDGSAAPPENPADERAGLTVGVRRTGAPHSAYGSQLQRRSIPGSTREGRLAVTWTSAPGALADGTPYELVSPSAQLLDLAFGPADVTALRVAPRLVGLGLLEAVPDSVLAQMADQNDGNGDGISGRARIVIDDVTGETALGRFGWKAGAASLRGQVARAYLRDMGVTTPVFAVDDETPAAPAPLGSIELSDADLTDVTTYVGTLGVPMRLDTDDPEVELGFETFLEAGCAACHTPTLLTAANGPHPALRSQVIHPFTDLLLHDMGEGLAEPDPAIGREWRTAPLWGIGRTSAVAGHTRFLHDGRARNLLEAILWHGGEAAAARNHVAALDAERRAALLRFLGSL